MATRKTTKKTTRKTTRKATPKPKDGAERVKQSANRIWLAGLGAFATAEEEGGKLFKSLVEKGKEFEQEGRDQLDKVRERVEELAESARERVGTATEDVRDRAGEAWDKVESSWEDRMGRAMHKLGVPTRDEIARLTRRIEDLTKLVEKQAKATTTRTRKAATPRRRSGRAAS